MQWPWHSKERVVYVPVPAYGDYATKWRDKGYLSAVLSAANSEFWIVENAQMLKEVRDLADSAEVPEELKAYQKCIKIIKDRLVFSGIAKQELEALKIMEQQQSNE